MELDDLSVKLLYKLQKHPIQAKYALSQFKVNNEAYRMSSEYTDPVHYPFYYYLGREVKIKNLLEFGFESGIETGCFLHGCKTIESYLGFKPRSDIHYWSPRITRKNIYNVLKKPIGYWHGDITDPEFLKQFLVKKWDCALVVRSWTRELNRRYLDLIWGQMSLGGLLVVDRVKSSPDMKSAFEDFCKVVHRPLTTLKTRYGVGLVVK
jgi:hypothetical protein